MEDNNAMNGGVGNEIDGSGGSVSSQTVRHGSSRVPEAVTEVNGFIVADSASVSTTTNSSDFVVWLSQTTMKKVGIWTMDVILLKAKCSKMICNVRAIEDECGKERILMNSVIRENLGVKLGDTVFYEYPIAVERGLKVVVSPVQEEIATQAEDYLLNEYIGPFFKRKNFVVHESNIFNAPSINGGKSAVFKIIRTTPTPFCEVGPGVIYSVEYGAHQKIKCETDAIVNVSTADTNSCISKKSIRTREGPKLSSSHTTVAVLQNEIDGTPTHKLEHKEEISVTSARDTTNKVKSGPKSDQASATVPTPHPPASSTASSPSIIETNDSTDQNYSTVQNNSYANQTEGSSKGKQNANSESQRQALVKNATSPSPVRPQQQSPPQRQAPSPPIAVVAQRPSQHGSGLAEKWLSQFIFKRNPYFPQLEDDLVYLRQGHELYVREVAKKSTHGLNPKLRKDLPYVKIPTMSAAEAVKVIGVEYDITKSSRFVQLKLALTDWHTGGRTGEEVFVKYRDIDGVFEFFVLRQIYDRSLLTNWNVLDKFRFMDPFNNSWVVGTIVKKKVYNAKFPDSHFYSYDVQWAGTKYRVPLSPWDMETIPEDFQYVIPRNPYDGVPAAEMDSDLSKNGIYKVSVDDWPAGGQEMECKRISKVISQVIPLPLSENFHKKYQEYFKKIAYPVDLHLIQARLDNLFYRRPAAIKTDIESICMSAAKFYGPAAAPSKNATLISELLQEIVANSKVLDICDCKPVSATDTPSEEWGSCPDPEVGSTSGRDTPGPSVSSSANRYNNPRAADPQRPQKRSNQQTGSAALDIDMQELGCANKKCCTRMSSKTSLNLHDKSETLGQLDADEAADEGDGDSNGELMS